MTLAFSIVIVNYVTRRCSHLGKETDCNSNDQERDRGSEKNNLDKIKNNTSLKASHSVIT